jgi:hypothetical protein
MRFACWITKATDTLRICNTYLLLFHVNNSYADAPQCYVIHTLPVLCVLARVLRSAPFPFLSYSLLEILFIGNWVTSCFCFQFSPMIFSDIKTWTSSSLFVRICPVVTESMTPCSHVFPWHCTCPVHFHKLAIYFHRCDTSHLQNLRVLCNSTRFPVGPPSLNWLYGHSTRLWCPLMAVWRNTINACPLRGEILCWIMLFHVGHVVTLFFNLICFQTNFSLRMFKRVS